MGHALQPRALGEHLDRLYRAAWLLCGSREDAEDLVQETCARVLARPRLLLREGDLPYLLRALRNTYRDRVRAESRRPAAGLLEDTLADRRGARQPERALEVAEVYAAIATLPRAAREVIVAVDVVGLSYREAAMALGVCEGTVMSRLSRARECVVRGLDPSRGSPTQRHASSRR